MKKITKLLLLALTGIALNSFAQTNIVGGTVSGTWTKANSPYNIQGSIQIVNGSTLNIEPGVTVNFQGSYKFLVLGQLLAVGTSTDTITFTAANTSTGWRGLRFDNTPSTNDTSKILYCKFQYGKATGTSPDDDGGALCFNNFSKAIVSNCRITNCTASLNGGGIFCQRSRAIIINNNISNNTAASDGGGIFCSYSSPVISNNIISNNTAVWGGGIYCYLNSPNIINNTISNNKSSSWGGGIVCQESSPSISKNSISNNKGEGIIISTLGSPSINNNIVSNNTGRGITCSGSSSISNNTISNNAGGGIYCSDSPSISNNTISYNTTSADGGGIYCYSSSSPSISNNTISNNTATASGGGIYCYYSKANISNNTISNNTALGTGTTSGGGGIYCIGSSPTITNNSIANNRAANGGALYCTSTSNPSIRNTILYGNTASSSVAQIYLSEETSDPSFYYCNVQGGTAAFELNGNFYTGTYQNNIDSIPLFVAPTAGSGTGYNGLTADWSLQLGSACIDKGTVDTTGLNIPATDRASNPRIVGSYIDIGAYEYQTGTPLTATITASGATSFCNGDSVKLTASTGTSYLWSNNATTSFIYVKVAGNYTVKVTDAKGLSATSAATTVTVNSLPQTPTITQNGNTLMSSATAGNQWYLNGNSISGATAQNYTPTQNGNYTVTVTDANSCSATSLAFNYTGVGIEEVAVNNRISISPNPSRGKFTVKIYDLRFTNYDLKVFNVLGEVMYQTSNIKHQTTNIDLSALPVGIYFLQVNTGEQIINRKIVLEK